MIEIKPALTTNPIKKITKVIREHQKLPEKKPSQGHKKQGEGENTDSSNDQDQQHIDEIV